MNVRVRPKPVLELKAQAAYSGWSDLRDTRVMIFSNRLVIIDEANPPNNDFWYSTMALTRAVVARGLNAVIPYKSILSIELRKKLLIKWVTIKFVDENNEERTIDIVGGKIDELYEIVKNLAGK